MWKWIFKLKKINDQRRFIFVSWFRQILCFFNIASIKSIKRINIYFITNSTEFVFMDFDFLKIIVWISYILLYILSYLRLIYCPTKINFIFLFWKLWCLIINVNQRLFVINYFWHLKFYRFKYWRFLIIWWVVEWQNIGFCLIIFVVANCACSDAEASVFCIRSSCRLHFLAFLFFNSYNRG